MEKIRQNLNPFGINFDDLRKLLIYTNSFVSGSFVLKVIETTDTTWTPSDIDIYTSIEYFTIFENFLIDHGYNKLNEDKHYVIPEMLEHKLQKCITYIRNDYKTQIITNDNKFILDPEKYVEKFDISICSNYFDGKFFHSLFPDDISNKKFSAKFVGPTMNHFDIRRINTYIERGYNLTNIKFVTVT